MQYTHKKHLFFDLDHTLWDFDKNAEETLNELFIQYKFVDLGIHSFDQFINCYTKNNQRVWALYHNGKIDKDELRRARFADTFNELGISPDRFPTDFEADYLRLCPHKTNLFPETHETLTYLKEKYVLHLISNGFKDAAEIKVAKTNIKHYFSQIIISENVGVHKPHPAIYHFSLNAAGANKEESIMIGDSIEADIRGAHSFGMDAIYFNPKGLPEPDDVTFSIKALAELRTLF
ncbi:YjjG family noncanonical pyrimidine nucleotidase [Olivibacter ginsenosidimutans]|uniref:YjjG family noncanonical pyrimidine nucleotidase n=1 Tax=Olivibacter ginsenosidimutans TaxID=1176537 RepID=A0ABP9CAB8_9SPHI